MPRYRSFGPSMDHHLGHRVPASALRRRRSAMGPTGRQGHTLGQQAAARRSVVGRPHCHCKPALCLSSLDSASTRRPCDPVLSFAGLTSHISPTTSMTPLQLFQYKLALFVDCEYLEETDRSVVRTCLARSCLLALSLLHLVLAHPHIHAP